MAKISIPEGLTGKAKIDWLVTNNKEIVRLKKAAIKKADAVTLSLVFVNARGEITTKAEEGDMPAYVEGEMAIAVVINTTNLMDSHDDVHIPGIWKQSLKQNSNFMLLNSHGYDFDSLISNNMRGTAEMMDWKDLGAPYEGKTQALVFRGKIYEKDNPGMFRHYKLGHVKQHSVGMRYINLELCVNDEDYKEAFAAWKKYRPMVANGEDADAEAYFYAITEASIIEGSAVLFGSNYVTPTLNENQKSNNVSTPQPPPDGTEKGPQVKTLIEILAGI